MVDQILLSKRRDSGSVSVPHNDDETFQLYRALVNVRPPRPVTDEYLKIQNEYLQELSKERGIVRLGDTECMGGDLYLWQGDITRLAADAIVNAAASCSSRSPWGAYICSLSERLYRWFRGLV